MYVQHWQNACTSITFKPKAYKISSFGGHLSHWLFLHGLSLKSHWYNNEKLGFTKNAVGLLTGMNAPCGWIDLGYLGHVCSQLYFTPLSRCSDLCRLLSMPWHCPFCLWSGVATLCRKTVGKISQVTCVTCLCVRKKWEFPFPPASALPPCSHYTGVTACLMRPRLCASSGVFLSAGETAFPSSSWEH